MYLGRGPKLSRVYTRAPRVPRGREHEKKTRRRNRKKKLDLLKMSIWYRVMCNVVLVVYWGILLRPTAGAVAVSYTHLTLPTICSV